MIGATLTISLPFHLLPASPAYAMVAAYAGIPPSKMVSSCFKLTVNSYHTSEVKINYGFPIEIVGFIGL